MSVNQATVDLPTAGSGVGGSVRGPVCGVDGRVAVILLAVGSGVVAISAQKLPPQP